MGVNNISKREHNLYALELPNNREGKIGAIIEKLKEDMPAIEDAIRKSGGWLTKAAAMLGCSSFTLSKVISQTPELLEIFIDIKEKYLDIAEIKLLQLVKAGDLEAIKYWLNNQGKKRGWGVKDENNNDKGTTIIFNIEPAFAVEEVKEQADIRIKELESREYIDIQVKDVTSTLQKKEDTDEEIADLQDESRSKDFIAALNDDLWKNDN